jgi:hypothetical protein
MNSTEKLSENVRVSEIVQINNLLRVQKQHLYEKELSKSTDKRYLLKKEEKKTQQDNSKF